MLELVSNCTTSQLMYLNWCAAAPLDLTLSQVMYLNWCPTAPLDLTLSQATVSQI